MPEEKKNIFNQLSPMNIIMLAVMVIGGLSTYFTLKNNIENHLLNDDIHLTEEQRTNLAKSTTIVEIELPTIETNENRIIAIEKDFAVFKSNFTFIASELEGLENKVSRNQEKSERNFVELNNKIDD